MVHVLVLYEADGAIASVVVRRHRETARAEGEGWTGSREWVRSADAVRTRGVGRGPVARREAVLYDRAIE